MDPTHERHQELHTALVQELGAGATLTLRQFAQWIMRCTGVGTRASVHNYADAMDLLGLVAYDRKDHDKAITVLEAWAPSPVLESDGMPQSGATVPAVAL